MALSTALRNDQADSLAALNRLEILDGAVVLATATVAFGAAATGTISADPASVNAVASGTADGARLYVNGDATREWTALTVSTVGGGGMVELQNLSINSGQPVDFTSVTITVPA